MEQLTFLEEIDTVETIIDDILRSCAEKVGYDIRLFERAANKKKGEIIGYSLKLNKDLIAKVDTALTEISASEKIMNTLKLGNTENIKKLKNPIGFIRYKCEPDEDGKTILKNILNKFVESYIPSERFGCCHRYVECSDARSCTAPDKFHARGCYYRENLEKGKIFYGKNAE